LLLEFPSTGKSQEQTVSTTKKTPVKLHSVGGSTQVYKIGVWAKI